MERLSAILPALAGCAFLYLAFKGAASGHVAYKAFVTHRDRNPIWYWLQVCGYGVLGAVLVIVGILGVVKR